MRYFFLIFPFLLNAQIYQDAVGWGSAWTFPISYEVYIVSNMNNSGAGSLRDALTSSISSDGRIIVGNGIAGTIDIASTIDVSSTKNIYLAGQTFGEIILKNDGFDGALISINSTDGTIIRGVTFAGGTGGLSSTSSIDNLRLAGGTNIIVDRNTFVWSVDGTLDITGATFVTISNNIIAESLDNSTHSKGLHSRAVLVAGGTEQLTFYQNLFASNSDRNPSIGGDSGGAPGSEFEMVRNVIYGWEYFGVKTGDTNQNINLIDNISISNSETSLDRYPFAFANEVDTVYAVGNLDDVHRTSPLDAEADAIGCVTCATFMRSPLPTSQVISTPFDYPLKDIARYSKQQVIDSVYAYVGDFNNSGSISSRIKSYWIAGTGALIDYPSDVGGYPTISAGTIITDTDSDGIPDSEETFWANDTFGYVNSLITESIPDSPPTPQILTTGSIKKKKYNPFNN